MSNSPTIRVSIPSSSGSSTSSGTESNMDHSPSTKQSAKAQATSPIRIPPPEIDNQEEELTGKATGAAKLGAKTSVKPPKLAPKRKPKHAEKSTAQPQVSREGHDCTHQRDSDKNDHYQHRDSARNQESPRLSLFFLRIDFSNTARVGTTVVDVTGTIDPVHVLDAVRLLGED